MLVSNHLLKLSNLQASLSYLSHRTLSTSVHHFANRKIMRHDPFYVPIINKVKSDEISAVEKIKKASQDPELQSESVRRTEAAKNRPIRDEAQENFAPFRFIYPEFLPDSNLEYRNRVREKLERLDMLKRRSNIEIPEFYVGSIMKVSVSDKYAVGKTNEFLGICIQRSGVGLRACFTLRNVIDGQGVEIRYEMYNPIIQSIQVLRLEKRLDESLMYLRDCPLEFSTFPMDMTPELRNPDQPVPINTTMVRLNAKPWTMKWHLYELRGIENLYEQIEEKWEYRKWEDTRKNRGTNSNFYDLMKTYRESIPAEEQAEIYAEVSPQLANLTQTLKKHKKKRAFVRPQKLA